MPDIVNGSKLDRIRTLNDILRRSFTGGRVMLTASVAEMEIAQKTKVMTAIQQFNEFDNDNDPHCEHDMVFVTVDGDKFIAKIDYYDLNVEYHSDDPADPTKTVRVLTIMRAEDY